MPVWLELSRGMENEGEDEVSEASWQEGGPRRPMKDFSFYSEPDEKPPEGLSRGVTGSD